MTTQAHTDALAPPSDPNQEGHPVHGRTLSVLRLVRSLIIFGKTLAITVRGFSPAETSRTIGLRFGTRNAAMILARITRGLYLAGLLEARLADRIARLGYKPPPAQTAAPSAESSPPPPRRRRTPRDHAESRSADLPTAEELAKELRRRPVHAVLADIVADLGLIQSDPLWSQVEQAVCELNGRVMKLLEELWNRPALAHSIPTKAASSVRPKPPAILQSYFGTYDIVATGPPWLSAQLRKK